jgi:hypothetical protein
MLGTALKSEGELSIQPLTSSGSMKLWVEEENTSFFKGCDLNFSFQQSPAISKANMTIHGDLLSAALILALRMASGKVDDLLRGAIQKLKDFNDKIDQEKKNLRDNAEQRKKQLERDCQFLQDKINDLKNIYNQLNFDSIKEFFEKHLKEAKEALLTALHKEKSEHTQWFHNGDHRYWPVEHAVYEFKQKIYNDLIGHVNNSIPILLEIIKNLKPVFDVFHPILKVIVKEILNVAEKALVIALDLAKKLLTLNLLLLRQP